MKPPQFHLLMPVYLVSLSLLVLGLLTPLLPAETPTAPAYVDPTQAKLVDASSLHQPPISQTGLPQTFSPPPAVSTHKLAAQPRPISEARPADFHNFVTQVSNGQSDVLRGVYVPGLFALPIIQQPEDKPIFVSNKHGQVTQFQSAARNGVTGLLAHNYLAGSFFYQLAPGHEVLMIHGDGAIQRYRVVSLHRYQKLKPSHLHSNLVDLTTGQELSAAEVFGRFYRGKPHLTFQTCLEQNGQLNWGFLFVVAVPLKR